MANEPAVLVDVRYDEEMSALMVRTRSGERERDYGINAALLRGRMGLAFAVNTVVSGIEEEWAEEGVAVDPGLSEQVHSKFAYFLNVSSL